MTDGKIGLVERNKAAFADSHPRVWTLLDAIAKPNSTLVSNGDTPENIDLGSGKLYPSAAAGWSKAQMEDVRQQPDNIVFSDVSHCNLSPISAKLLDELTAFIREQGWTDSRFIAPQPLVDAGYVFVFGIGLGHHIPDLVNSSLTRHMILIEPVAEFILHSFAAIDWEAVFRDAATNGITIHFVLKTEPTEIVEHVEQILMRWGVILLEGSYYCPHYYSWILKEAYTQLKERVKHFYISTGYFEGGVGMLQHCHENLRKWSFRLVEGKSHAKQSYPVFLIGSGPSLDKDIAHIKKWRDHAIILSCGTALRSLLKNGIRPDLHCENERVPLVLDILTQCRDEFGLDGITLVATTTINPDVADLFENRWYYFRSNNSPPSLLSAGTDPLPHASPLVTNAALAVVSALGFQNVYLFGVDCGQKERGLHHAKDAPYFQKEHIHLDENMQTRYDRILPGNFGGTVKTFWAYDLGRRMLGNLQQSAKLNLLNCSDGALIPGAQPKVAASINLPEDLPLHGKVMKQLESQMRFYERGGILKEIDLTPDIEGCERFPTAFGEYIGEIVRDATGMWDIERGVSRFIDDHEKDFYAFMVLAKPSMRSMVRLAAFFGNRIVDDKNRQAFVNYFAIKYVERCIEMAEEAKQLFSTLKNSVPLPEAHFSRQSA